MGVCYDLISDHTREGYELGKGLWGEGDFERALRSEDPVGEVAALLVEDGYEPTDAAAIAREIAAFATGHPDWRIVNDCGGWDGNVVDDERWAELVASGWDPDDPVFPMYRQIGSRHQIDMIERTGK